MINPNTIKIFIEEYPQKGKLWCIDKLGMSDRQVRHYACKYGLISKFKYSKEANIKRGTGFTGKKHTKESLKKMSESSLKMWNNPLSKLNSKANKQAVSDRMSKNYWNYHNKNVNQYTYTKSSWETIGGKKHFFRSSWEVVYAKYLEFLKRQEKIIDWEYEKDVFWFNKIKRGVRSYKPDFKVTNNDKTIEYHEVKGWLDKRSKTKLKRMKLYYPKIKMVLIDGKAFKEIKKWERLY